MLQWIIHASLSHRFLVVTLAVVLGGTGLFALSKLPIDAFPDTTPVQVQINTVAPALAPLEIEHQITQPVEQAIGGLPGLTELRSISKFGLSQVTVVFDDDTDLNFARHLVSERLHSVRLPEGIDAPEMGPSATGLGEIYHYLVTSQSHSLEALTTLHDWEIKPALRGVPGVAEVNTWGGHRRQYHALVDPLRLMKYDLTLDQVFEALRRNNLSVGGGVVEVAGEQHLVQGISLTTSLEEIGAIVITAHDGVPIRIADVADVEIGHEIRRGAVTANGQGEVVLGLGFMLMGENSHEVTRGLQERMNDIRGSLPPGVEIQPVYERTELVEKVIATVQRNLLEGALLVVAVLFAFLGNLRAGLIVALAIPISMLFAFNAMLQAGIAGSLMSLGAIDFGLVVDGCVISVENSVRRLGHAPPGRSTIDVVRDATVEVRRPTMYGEIIIMIVYLPILTLEGIEGKLFRPMALTVIFALTGSLILTLTLMPVLASLLLSRKRIHGEPRLIRFCQALYRPVVRFAVQARTQVILLALTLVGGTALLATRLGSEFIPRLSEMAIAINTVRLAGVSLDESVRYGTQIEKLILERFPDEVRDVWTRTGTAEVATDPMGIELSDVFITLTPRAQWTRALTQDDLVAQMDAELADLPGMRVLFSQPIEMRINEMVAGIRTDLGIKLFGDDLDVLRAQAARIDDILRTIPGSADVYTEQITGQPLLEIRVNQEAIARYGLPAEEVLALVEMIGGKKVGEIREGLRTFDMVVRLTGPHRQDPDAISRLVLPTPAGERIPLAQLATIRQLDGPSTITREGLRRRILVQCNVRGRDVAGFVAEAREKIEEQIDLPSGYQMRFGGQFEHLIRARARLMIVVPMALFIIFMLLYTSTGSVRDALLVFTAAPFASVGGIVALWLRDMPFTISAGVGFVAVSGVAMLAGLVLVSTILQLIGMGLKLDAAIEESALRRLRPILMTATVAALGFVPMAFNTGVGAEVQRPLATVVIGGVVSANLLTLIVLPALYARFGAAGRKTLSAFEPEPAASGSMEVI